jgi:carbonic anhydrase
MKALHVALLSVMFFVIQCTVYASSGESTWTSDQAMKLIQEGNLRFVAQKMTFPNQSEGRMQQVTSGQNPYATILTCSDSRVPAEMIFDAGLGDLFVVRVAGNVADVDEVGTIEYGVDHLETPLLVVLGHTGCGAVTAVVNKTEVHGSIPMLVDNITPAVEKAQKKHPELKNQELVPAAITENIWQSIEDIFRQSPAVCERVASGRLEVIGALYNLESGKVEWLGKHRHQDCLVEMSEEPLHGADLTDPYEQMKWHVPSVAKETSHKEVTAEQAIRTLQKANQRFTSNERIHPHLSATRLKEVASEQRPFATVLSCSDSRVPIEHIFDAGLGDLFVVRVAGNVADVDEIGTIEYGVGHLHTPLLVVLGHTACGAVTAVATDAELHGSIPQLVDNIIPAVRATAERFPGVPMKELVPAAIKANVWQSIADIYEHSPEVCTLVNAGQLKVVGAIYHLEDGSVEWLGSHPKQSEIVAERMQFFSSDDEH